MKNIISLLYVILFVVSEFRLKKLKFLTSIPYSIILLTCLCGVLAIDSFIYEFTNLTYFLLSLTLFLQISSLLCRIYLWNDRDHPWGRFVHPHANNEEPYYPRTLNFFDYIIILVLCLYIYMTNDI